MDNVYKCHVCGCQVFLYPTANVVPHYGPDGKKCAANNQPWQDTRTEEDKKLESIYRERLMAIYNDAMIAHKWFAKHFGEQMNGCDFAVKCEMADRILAEREQADRALVTAANNMLAVSYELYGSMEMIAYELKDAVTAFEKSRGKQ